MNLTNVIYKEKLRENAKVEDGPRIALEEGLQKDSNAKGVEEGSEADLSQGKNKTIIGLNEEEGHILKDIKKEEEPIEYYKQHHDEVLVRCQREIELLEYFLKEREYENVTAVRKEGESQHLIGIEICVSCKVSDVQANREEEVDKYAVKKMTDNLLLQSKFEYKKQQMEIAEEYVFKDIKDVWMVEKAEQGSHQVKNESEKLQ